MGACGINLDLSVAGRRKFSAVSTGKLSVPGGDCHKKKEDISDRFAGYYALFLFKT